MTTSEELIAKNGFVDIPLEPTLDPKEEIEWLKKEKNALILAHFYQKSEVQDIADFVGDSLELTSFIGSTDAELIIFGGVYFMAETAKILYPDRRIILPDLTAGCSLADSCPSEQFKEFVKAHPGHVVISYINCSAKIKALSDIVCTSSNALKVINSIPRDLPILFAPDRNLGRYIAMITGREMTLWPGHCEVHASFDPEKIKALQQRYPFAELIAHPESEPDILKISSFVGSTSQLIKYVEKSTNKEFIVATEAGVLHEMKKKAPYKKILAAPVNDQKRGECENMKKISLEKVFRALRYEKPEVTVDAILRQQAIKPIRRMFDL